MTPDGAIIDGSDKVQAAVRGLMIDSDLACFQLTIQAPYYVLMRMHHSS